MGQQEDHIVLGIQENIAQAPNPRNPTICRIPQFLVDIDNRILQPQLASFGPRHSGTSRLIPFKDRKLKLQSKFLLRKEGLERDLRDYLNQEKENIRSCYSENIFDDLDLNNSDLVEMMLLDGSFMLELFLEYDKDPRDLDWLNWQCPFLILIADLLNLENQLPFFILQGFFDLSRIATTHTLPNLALRFLNQAFSGPMANSQIQEPVHLLDLFRRSLLPSINPDPQQSNHFDWRDPIPRVKDLRSAGITVRQKTARSLLEIDFRKFHIPPLALKIPPFAIDDLTKAILVNCVAMELCFWDQSKHFTAYVCFMSCLIKDSEDVGCLRSVDIIRGYSQGEGRFIKMLHRIGKNASFTLRECYLWKPFREIQSYRNSCWASIRPLLAFNNIMLYCSLLQIAVGMLSWRFPVNLSSPPTSSVPND